LIALAATLSVLGVHALLLLLAAGCLGGAIALAWRSVETFADKGELTVEDALALAAPSALEEQKGAVLRALKDLDYELSVGKVSHADYRELSEQYRQEARRLMAELDESLASTRREVEDLVKSRLDAEGVGTATTLHEGSEALPEKTEASGAPESEAPAPLTASSPPPSARGIVCSACSTHNDEDARFCKKCGERLQLSPAAEAL
jgi:hypothetical protein